LKKYRFYTCLFLGRNEQQHKNAVCVFHTKMITQSKKKVPAPVGAGT